MAKAMERASAASLLAGLGTAALLAVHYFVRGRLRRACWHLLGPAAWRIAEPPFSTAAAPLSYRLRIVSGDADFSVVRYDRVPAGLGDGDDASIETYPSLFFAEPQQREVPLGRIEHVDGEAGMHFVPWFSRTADGEASLIELTTPMTGRCSVYGTGMVSGGLERTGTVVACWNHDNFGHAAEAPLYQPMPWLLVLLDDGSAVGVFVDTTYPVVVDLCTTGVLRFRVLAPADVNLPVVVLGPCASPLALLGRLPSLLGRTPMPPLWALGYHQCRWSYATAERMLEIGRAARAHAMPCDAVWADIDYMRAYRSFSFDAKRFPDPAATSDSLRALGLRSVYILDPGIALHAADDVARRTGDSADVWVRAGPEPQAAPATAVVWPGLCTFPDFSCERARAWWGRLVMELLQRGGMDGL